MAQSLDDLRKQIDATDDQLHDLLIRRAELVLEIAEEKRRTGAPVVQPHREIAVLRRLLGRHRGKLPREAVVRIWRELTGAVSLLQAPLKVIVASDEPGGQAAAELAKDYFASVLPMSKAANALSALSAVRDGDATFAVVPRPLDEETNPWWRVLTDNNDKDDRPLRIVARLPVGDRSRPESRPERDALVVARLKFEASGDDRSFLLLDLESSVSRTRIVERCGEAGLAARSLCTWAMRGTDRILCLIEVDGFVGAGDDRLAQIATKLDPLGKGMVVGGYPAPLVFDDKVGKNAAPAELAPPPTAKLA